VAICFLLTVFFLAAALSHLAGRSIDRLDSMRSSDRAKAVSCLSAFINKLWQLNK